MTRRRVAVAVFASSGGFGLFAVAAALVWGNTRHEIGAVGVVPLAYGVVFALIGLLLTVRQPLNRIGWCFAATGLIAEVQASTIVYADAGLRPGGPHLVAAAVVGNVTQWVFAPGVLTGYTLPFLWMPDGRLSSPRWRWVLRAGVLGTVMTCLFNLVASGPLQNYPHVQNPLGIGLAGFGALDAFWLLLYCGALFASVGAVVGRYRRATGIERLQLRWVIVGVWGSALAFVVMLALLFLTGDVGAGVLLMAVLPVCSAIAILRYRLFDLDRILSRTLSYAVVTGLLVGTYVVVIAVTTRLLPVSSSVGVATSTLAVAAAFNPVRRRVQTVVDHRFNRARYDASRTVERFSERLREAVDPASIRTDLLDVTARVVQPASVSLWVAGSRPAI